MPVFSWELFYVAITGLIPAQPIMSVLCRCEVPAGSSIALASAFSAVSLSCAGGESESASQVAITEGCVFLDSWFLVYFAVPCVLPPFFWLLEGVAVVERHV